MESKLFKFCAIFIISVGVASPAIAEEQSRDLKNQRYEIISIKRDVASGTNIRTVNSTMMLDVQTGKNWILDEVKGRWVPVGYHNELSGEDATLTPK